MALVPVDADEATTENNFNLGNRSESRVSRDVEHAVQYIREAVGCGHGAPSQRFFLLICCATTMNSHDLHREGPFFVS